MAHENTEDAIRMLAAQKEIYSYAKILAFAQTFVVVPTPILLSLGCLYFDIPTDQTNNIFIIYTIVGSVIEILLEFWIKQLKVDAASIQELFDVQTFGIHWNDALVPGRPDSGMIYRFFKKHSKNNDLSILQNWYSPEIREAPSNIAVIICQRTNCTYDFILKKRYTIAVLITAVLVFLSLLIVSAYDDLSVRSFFIQVLAPLLPIFIWSIKRIAANREAIKSLHELKSLIERILQDSKLDSIIDESAIRQIQDKIYSGRISSPMLPDWLFFMLRNDLESEMHFTVKDKIKELKSKNDKTPS